MATYLVTVRADYPWTTARVNGQMFHKTDVVRLTDEQLTDEIRTSGLLTLVPLDAAPPPDAPAPLSVDKADDAPVEAEPHPEETPPTRGARRGTRGGKP